MKKTLFGIALFLDATLAQSWTDSVGVCPRKFTDSEFKLSGQAKENYQWFPSADKLTLDGPPLLGALYEVQTNQKKDEPIRCISFVADDKVKTKSQRYCSTEVQPEDFDKKVVMEEKALIPLWNIKSIQSQVQVSSGKIVQLIFETKYQNVSDPTGYYKYDPSTETYLNEAGEQTAEDPRIANGVYVQDEDTGEYGYKMPTYGEFIDSRGSFMQKWFNVSMMKYDNFYSVKLLNVEAGDDAQPIVPGCRVDIVDGNSIQGVKFFTNPADGVFMNSLQFRVKPIEEYYDTTHSYSQNGDIYSVGYDKDFYDGKVEYTANGYPPQSFKWKLSRSYATYWVTNFAMVGVTLIGSYAL